MSEERSKIMDNLIAQDADLIDNPLQAAVRELLTDDSMEHLGVFTHNLVQALDKHGLKAVRAEQAAELAKWKALAETLAGAVTEAREALHFHYVEWDGESEDAVPLQLARSKCDAALTSYKEQHDA